MRRRYVQLADGSLVDISDAPPVELRADSGALWGDRGYTDCRATDGTLLDTRTKHREYMRARGLTTADDFKQQWQRESGSRDQFYTSAPDRERAHQIARAMDNYRGS